jgi:hypothetical protein
VRPVRRPRDVIATVLVVALAVLYLVVVTGQEVLLADDLRAVTALSLMLGGSALVALADDEYNDPVSWMTTLLGGAATVSGLLTLAFLESAAAQVLLTVFVGLVLAVWAVQLAEHLTVRPPPHREGRSS